MKGFIWWRWLIVILIASVATMVSEATTVGSEAQSGRELGELFPSSIGGRPLVVRTWSGPEWIARYDPDVPEGAAAIEQAETFLATTGTSADELDVATALLRPSPGNMATISAMRLAGAEAHRLAESSVRLMRPDISRPTLSLRHISDRTVLKVSDRAAAGAYPVTVYPVDDTVWFVDAGGPLLEDILAALPPPAADARPGYDLAAVFPTRIGGERRDILSIASGWRPMQASFIRFDWTGIEEQLFLATGAGKYDLNSASGISLESGLLPGVSAYQIAAADEDVMQEVLHDIVLPRVAAGAARSEPAEIAGRPLLEVQAPPASGDRKLLRSAYIYVSGDTIWWLEAEEPHLTELLEQLP